MFVPARVADHLVVQFPPVRFAGLPATVPAVGTAVLHWKWKERYSNGCCRCTYNGLKTKASSSDRSVEIRGSSCPDSLPGNADRSTRETASIARPPGGTAGRWTFEFRAEFHRNAGSLPPDPTARRAGQRRARSDDRTDDPIGTNGRSRTASREVRNRRTGRGSNTARLKTEHGKQQS